MLATSWYRSGILDRKSIEKMLRIAVNLNRACLDQGGFRKAAAQHSNRAHTGLLCGCNVIGRIADNDDLAGAQFQAAQRYVENVGVRFRSLRIIGSYFHQRQRFDTGDFLV
jgi:hypothetical protein